MNLDSMHLSIHLPISYEISIFLPPLRYSRRMRLAGHIGRMGQMKNAYKILIGKPEEKRPLGRPRHIIVEGVLGEWKYS
jgi:hypothetical protein